MHKLSRDGHSCIKFVTGTLSAFTKPPLELCNSIPGQYFLTTLEIL
jgi:hypothetical protein